MLVSFDWLKEFVEIEDSAEEIADILTMGGIEVEGITRVGDGLDKVVTARVEDVIPHPSADKLNLARISMGSSEETVVCGAPNVKKGQVSAYAAPGIVLPSGLEITARKVKGVLSPGMICSEKELGLTDDHSGIMELEPETPVGVRLTQALPFIDDYILQTAVTPNRGDCLSILGTAREVAALTGRKWKVPKFRIQEGSVSIHDKMVIEVPDIDLCPRYVARMVEGVGFVSSPLEVRVKLIRSGLRPISAVVDATNLILLECGQPLHAFDYSLLERGKIVVRRCDPGEVFTTLDNEERRLPVDALMIRDANRSVALAGIMGGLNSEINEETTAVLIESACFDGIGIRKTAKALGMATEASFRFERGVDPEGTLWAAHRAAHLIRKLAGGTILSGTIDVYPKPITRHPVVVRPKRVNCFLGTSLKKKEISFCLERLGIAVNPKGKDALECAAPSWRWDLDREEDMMEEVARIYGFQNIPVSMPTYTSAPDRTGESHNRLGTVCALMNTSGFTEVVTMSFTSKSEAREFLVDGNKEGELALLNPISEEHVVMRTSLIPGLLSAMKRNVSFKIEDLRIFELGKAFLARPGQDLPVEELRVAGLASGLRYPGMWHFQRGEVDTRGKIDNIREVDFYDIKGAIENLFEGLGVSDVKFIPSKKPFLHRGKSADLVLEGQTIGFAGQLSPAKIREHDLPGNVQIFEILLEPLFIRWCKESVFKPIPRYPYIERDLSFIVEEKVSGDVIKHLISRLGHDIITSVVLFDLYRGETIPKGYQSMAFRIRYQSEDRTLTDEDAQEVHRSVAEALVREVDAKMRE